MNRRWYCANSARPGTSSSCLCSVAIDRVRLASRRRSFWTWSCSSSNCTDTLSLSLSGVALSCASLQWQRERTNYTQVTHKSSYNNFLIRDMETYLCWTLDMRWLQLWGICSFKLKKWQPEEIICNNTNRWTRIWKIVVWLWMVVWYYVWQQCTNFIVFFKVYRTLTYFICWRRHETENSNLVFTDFNHLGLAILNLLAI
jgi:hypothetical protein